SQHQNLTALDNMYLRAGDILHHLSSQPNQSVDPQLRPILDLYTQLRLDQDHAAHPMPMPPPTVDPHPVSTGTDPGQKMIRPQRRIPSTRSRTTGLPPPSIGPPERTHP